VKAINVSSGIKGVAALRCRLQSLCEGTRHEDAEQEEVRIKVLVSIGFHEVFFKYVNKGEMEKV
jgi:hypothetical protein